MIVGILPLAGTLRSGQLATAVTESRPLLGMTVAHPKKLRMTGRATNLSSLLGLVAPSRQFV